LNSHVAREIWIDPDLDCPVSKGCYFAGDTSRSIITLVVERICVLPARGNACTIDGMNPAREPIYVRLVRITKIRCGHLLAPPCRSMVYRTWEYRDMTRDFFLLDVTEGTVDVSMYSTLREIDPVPAEIWHYDR
jgi:hypothetical protein